MPEHDVQAVLAAISDLKTDVAVVQTEATAIKEHLARLNGKVASHEKELGELKLRQASREDSCPMVEALKNDINPLHDYVVAQQAATAATRGWADRLAPGMWMIAGIITTLVLLHGRDLIAAIPSK